jgi:DNA-binding NtrC family response regulator
VHTAASGAEGLACIREREFALVFLDMRMPGMDGIQVLDELRKACPGTPVIIVTAYATMETATQALEMGAMDCLIKPFNRRDVDRLIERALAAG